MTMTQASSTAATAAPSAPHLSQEVLDCRALQLRLDPRGGLRRQVVKRDVARGLIVEGHGRVADLRGPRPDATRGRNRAWP